MGLKLGPDMWALIYLDLLNRGAGPKAMVPTSVINSFDLVIPFGHQKGLKLVHSAIWMKLSLIDPFRSDGCLPGRQGREFLSLICF